MNTRTAKGKFKKGHGGRSALFNVRKFFPKVERVDDAVEDIEIEVTNAHAKSAKKLDHNGCALAVACQKTLPIDGVVISIATAYLIKGKKALRYKMPEAAQREIVTFDRSGFFEPGVYKLKRPSPAMTLGHHTGSDKATRTGTGTKQTLIHHTGGIRAALGTKAI